MTLDQYMQEKNLTDEAFGKLIGKSRIQVYRYRHRLQIPRENTMGRIFEETGGQVPASSFYPDQASFQEAKA